MLRNTIYTLFLVALLAVTAIGCGPTHKTAFDVPDDYVNLVPADKTPAPYDRFLEIRKFTDAQMRDPRNLGFRHSAVTYRVIDPFAKNPNGTPFEFFVTFPHMSHTAAVGMQDAVNTIYDIGMTPGLVVEYPDVASVNRDASAGGVARGTGRDYDVLKPKAQAGDRLVFEVVNSSMVSLVVQTYTGYNSLCTVAEFGIDRNRCNEEVAELQKEAAEIPLPQAPQPPTQQPAVPLPQPSPPATTEPDVPLPIPTPENGQRTSRSGSSGSAGNDGSASGPGSSGVSSAGAFQIPRGFQVFIVLILGLAVYLLFAWSKGWRPFGSGTGGQGGGGGATPGSTTGGTGTGPTSP